MSLSLKIYRNNGYHRPTPTWVRSIFIARRWIHENPDKFVFLALSASVAALWLTTGRLV